MVKQLEAAHTFKERITATTLGRFSYAVLNGVMGTLVITVFLSSFLYENSLLLWLPWIIGFNCLTAGYALSFNCDHSVSTRSLLTICVGLLSTFLIHLALETFLNYEVITNQTQAYTLTFIATTTCLAGSWLGSKQHKEEE